MNNPTPDILKAVLEASWQGSLVILLILLLRPLGEACAAMTGWRVHAWMFMGNHDHLKTLPVQIVSEITLPPVSPTHDVVERPLKLHSEVPGHMQEVAAWSKI